MGDENRKPTFVPDKRPVAGRDRKGEPPAWAIGAMIGIVSCVGLLFSFGRGGGLLYDLIPWARSDYFWIGLIALPFVALMALAALSKAIDYRKASSWTATSGRILSSTIQVRRHRFQGEAETVENAPAVEYEFSIGARSYRGSRIGIGDDSGGANAETTLARYPQGAAVTVFYDPNDPRNCVLERSGPQGVTTLGCAGALAELALAGAAIYWLITRGPDAIAARFPKSDPEVAIFAACFGLVALLLFVAAHRYSKQAQKWPSVRGTIVQSAIESYRETSNGRTTTMYRPAVEYSYQVHGRELHGAQIKLGMTAGGMQAYAEKIAARYPVGGAVEVHYDPTNPSTAALENPTGATWLVALLALAMFGLAAYALGIFR
jgi:hypothetical protein